MGAVPVLIMLAAVGVDYGWQPDGTTSPQGDNVQYIIQISPDQLDQVRSVGEITSTIDPSIQGRVSQIVVQVGSGPLPRDAGRALSSNVPSAASPITQAVALADDAAQIPIPEIADAPQAALASRPSTDAELRGRAGSESLMKPDPQGSGFSLPEGLQTPVRTNPAVSTDPAARDDSWADISGRAGTAHAGAAAGAAPPTGVAPPSTDPVDPATRPQNSAASDINAIMQSRQGPLGSATGPAASDAARSTAAQPLASATGSAGSGSLQMPTAAAVGSAGTRPTDPSDPTWSGYGTTPNFGTLPPGLASGTAITRPPNNTQYTATGAGVPAAETQRPSAAQPQHASGPTGQTAVASDGYGRDAAGNLLDRLGRVVDSQGRPIDPVTRQLVDAAGNWIDEYGRLIDRLGRPLPAEPATPSTSTGNANLQAPVVPPQRPGVTDYAQQNGYAPGAATNYNQQPYAPPAQGQNFPAPSPTGQAHPAAYPSTPSYGQGNQPNSPPYNVAQGNTAFPSNPGHYSPTPPNNYASAPAANEPRNDLRPTSSSDFPRSRRDYDEDDFLSPSDSRRPPPSRTGSAASSLDRDLAAPTTSPPAARSRSVEAQPFFWFLGLISMVGNAYLIYETAILRRKFRNMIASVRAAKLATQPANS